MHQIIADEDETAQACAKEINDVLVKYGCMLEPITVISSQGVSAMVNVLAVNKIKNVIN